MCYLCLKDSPLTKRDPPELAGLTHRKLKRAADIKAVIRDAEGKELCYMGRAAIEILKQEQYELARDM